MKKILYSLFTIFVIAAVAITLTHPDWLVIPPFVKVSAAECVGNPDGQCEFNPNGGLDKNPTPPDPNRPYFDACGNEYDYQGNLIAQGTGCPATAPQNSSNAAPANAIAPAATPQTSADTPAEPPAASNLEGK